MLAVSLFKYISRKDQFDAGQFGSHCFLLCLVKQMKIGTIDALCALIVFV